MPIDVKPQNVVPTILNIAWYCCQADNAVSDLHDAVYLYGMWINYTTEYNLDHRNGTAFLEFCKLKQFEGKTVYFCFRVVDALYALYSQRRVLCR